MSSNVGLTTPRGSGTSGYVQRNLSNLRPRDRDQPYPDRDSLDSLKHRQRQPDKDILEHDRKREIEVKVFELRDRLEDEGLNEDDIEDQCDALRKKLESSRTRAGDKSVGPNAKALKSHQVHELAKAKIEESDKLRRALGIDKEYEEGSHWKRQEERKKDVERERGKAPMPHRSDDSGSESDHDHRGGHSRRRNDYYDRD
nr:pre-mrna-splicing factor cwc21 [Quercus suber]